ncbi:MAG: glycosyltransferase family 2 protein [Myxococcales bacterium]
MALCPTGEAAVNFLGFLLEVALSSVAAALLAPEAIVAAETFGALLPRRRRGRVGLQNGRIMAAGTPRVAVLVPAHDEAAQIGDTVRSLTAQLNPRDRLIVIADNCDDDTAARARHAGATVIERKDDQRQGKGFAIGFALERLAADPPDIVVVVDADCRVSPGGVGKLARMARARDRPVQAEYVINPPPNPSPLSVVSGLAMIIRNRVRSRGLARLGFPCQLAGTGMAFPWKVLRDAPAMGDELVEDLVMGLQMALSGHPPVFCPDVRITSELPQTRGAAIKQRRRWEHGHLQTLVTYFPRLLAAGVRRRSAALVGMGLDLMVPPLALLVLLQGAVLTAALLGGLSGATSYRPAKIACAGLGLLAAGVGTGWLVFGRRVAPLRYVAFIPFYVMWKVPMYLSLVVRGKQKTWERTPRRAEEAVAAQVPRSSLGGDPRQRPALAAVPR